MQFFRLFCLCSCLGGCGLIVIVGKKSEQFEHLLTIGFTGWICGCIGLWIINIIDEKEEEDAEIAAKAAHILQAAMHEKRERESAERACIRKEYAERQFQQEADERERRERESAERIRRQSESAERARRQRESAESEKYARKNSEILFRRAMQKVHPDRAPEHLQGMCQKLTAELNAARKAGDYRKIREIAESVGVSLSDGE